MIFPDRESLMGLLLLDSMHISIMRIQCKDKQVHDQRPILRSSIDNAGVIYTYSMVFFQKQSFTLLQAGLGLIHALPGWCLPVIFRINRACVQIPDASKKKETGGKKKHDGWPFAFSIIIHSGHLSLQCNVEVQPISTRQITYFS